MERPRVYLAGPDVFERDPRACAQELKAICDARGMEGVFPLDAEVTTSEAAAGGPEHGLRISEANERLIRECDGVLANLTPFRGPSADPGTIYEVGFASGLGKIVVGYTLAEKHFFDRTVEWMHLFGQEPTKRTDGSLEDAAGMQIESFGLVDNLMIPGGIKASGGVVVGPADARADGSTVLELAASQLAERLGTI